ncbi:DUF2634 domain-containing protein [Desulfosporosinus sp. PR]|uniref:DUF2634 domain-containing protein n=1 Tax=Candidatus Desulfosporosinus nitrosoreducens TaxID=3401928 RepID=UPI0027EE858B|nr:DUF2634 domain-containing protein [Desulfosporosinus sp. PR]MDQ7096943.1 DUF2634 domain-containing protein [Desulfosporosinus sp. PR]
MSIFPAETINVSDLILATETAADDLPLAREYAWDFDKNDFLLVNGKNIIVTGKEAVKVWIWQALNTPKNRYQAYSTSYGNELALLINQGFSAGALRSEVERYLKEALLINPYITGIKNIDMIVDGNKMDVGFTVTTIYGEESINV